MAERKERTISPTFEDVKDVLTNFKETYMNRPPVIGAGLGMERPTKGRERFVFKVYLEKEPTEEQQRSLKKTFRGVPIKYELTGPIVAAGIESFEVPTQYGPESRWLDPALENLERWLTNHGADPIVAQSAPEDIWVFEAYKIIPYFGKPLPIGLAAQKGSDNQYDVWAYVNAPTEKPEVVAELSEPFQELTDRSEAPKTETNLVFPTYHLELMPEARDEDFETRVRKLTQKHSRDFLGVYHHDPERDLHTIMEPETVGPWLDTPNAFTGARKPRTLLGTKEEWIIRDMIMSVRHGSVS